MEEHSKSITSHNTVEPIPLRWNQSVNQPVQSVCQPVNLQNRPNQPVDQLTTQPVDQSMHQPAQQQEIQPENQPAPTHIMDRPTNQPNRTPTNEPTRKPTREPTRKPTEKKEEEKQTRRFQCIIQIHQQHHT